MTTKDNIQNRINSRINLSANQLEGGFSQDIIESVAYELANIKDTQIDTIADRCFVSTAQRKDLDNVGADYGIHRRESSAAFVQLEITGAPLAVVNKNIKVIFNNIIFTVQEYKKIDSSGVVTVLAKCETIGSIGNVVANTLNKFLAEYEGLNTVNNPEAAYDGFDKEDDETYRQRILAYLAQDATNANKAQYHKWATEVIGVEKAVVKSAEVMGAGNVGVYISAIGTEVSEKLKQSVYDYINAIQPINATVIVNALEYVNVNVSAQLVIKNGYTAVNVKNEFETKLKNYLVTVENVVSYFKISELLFDCSGIEDVVSYTLNGKKESLALSDIQYPVIGEINVN